MCRVVQHELWLQAVVKGGQLLPIRSCIEAFLKGDETALQSTLGPSSAELQQMLLRMVWAADSNGAASSAVAVSAAGAASLTAAQASFDTTRASPAIKAGHLHPDGSSSSNISTASDAQAAQSTPEAALQAPATASASRAEMQPCEHDTSSQSHLAVGGSGHDGGAAEAGQIDREEEAGCDVLVKYLLREFLGSDINSQL